MNRRESAKRSFYQLVAPSLPNEWEVDDAFELLAGLEPAQAEALLAQVPAVWPVSHALCFSFLAEGTKALRHFEVELLPRWVRGLLSSYEEGGLVAARRFMATVEESFLAPMRGEQPVSLPDIHGRLRAFLNGLAGQPMALEADNVPWTDSETVFVPPELGVFAHAKENLLFYRLLVCLQWSYLSTGVVCDIARGKISPPRGPQAIREPQLASDALALWCLACAWALLADRLPGLIRQSRPCCHQLLERLPVSPENPRLATCKSFLLQIISGHSDWLGSNLLTPQAIFKQLADLPGAMELGNCRLLLGTFRPAETKARLAVQLKEKQRVFAAQLLEVMAHTEKEGQNGSSAEQRLQADRLLLMVQREKSEESLGKPRLVDNPGFEIPEELAALASELREQEGALEEAVAQALSGFAGGGMQRQGALRAQDEAAVAKDGIPYDEWDYRRGGYRSKWCVVREKELAPVRSTFLADTLDRYSGQLRLMRRQFEALRTRERLLGRQLDGDEIDLDALTDALGDSQAGGSPSEQLFVRRIRDDRDIGACFMVDMSNSTEGWVGQAIKEALVLLAECLKVAGDPYAIYGFSGMRRSRSDLFVIKAFNDIYSDEVQGRIAAITPREYTRMGPAIRHLSHKLSEIPCRVRLLVVISDGKPEDYDDYKGQYAIEDTRKALQEARGKGIRPFCITIDKAAHEYLDYMFGAGNGIYVNRVAALPARLSEMYRLLTR